MDMETPKIALLGKTLYEIQQITANLGMPKFAAKQIASWLYDKKVASIDEMTNLSLKPNSISVRGLPSRSWTVAFSRSRMS